MSNVSPSSQNSFPTFLPSPQISVQVLSVIAILFVQLYPASMEQVELHPSPSLLLLSSHCSVDTIKLSPHTGEQIVADIASPPVQL